MMRNFCVLTCEAALDKSGNWSLEYTNHRVLVGPKAKCDFCNDKIKEVMGEKENEKGWTFGKINE